MTFMKLAVIYSVNDSEDVCSMFDYEHDDESADDLIQMFIADGLDWEDFSFIDSVSIKAVGIRPAGTKDTWDYLYREAA